MTLRVAPVGGVGIAEAMDPAGELHVRPGSIGRRMASAVKFVQDGGGRAIFGPLRKALDALAGRTGAEIVPHALARRSRVPGGRLAVSRQEASKRS